MKSPMGHPWRRIVFWIAFALVVAAFGVTVGGAASQFPDAVTVTSISMANTFRPGDRVLYVPPGSLRRGDLVLERVPAQAGAPDLVIRRVIGLPGDRVKCCDPSGRITLDGKPLEEPYVYPGNQPSAIRFSVAVPQGMYWLLGDHRSVSLDSRERGAIPRGDIVGRAVVLVRGSSITSLRTPRVFVADGLAPVDSRPTLPWAWMGASVLATLLLLGFLIFGLVTFMIRRRRRRRARRTGADGSSGGPVGGGGAVGGGAAGAVRPGAV